MRVLAQPAFVLHTRPWRESSLLVELLTRDHGRVGAVARGVHGPKKQPLRAALQPLQEIAVDYVQRGELAQLRGAEALSAAPALVGEALLAAFYVNELVLRLAPRNDPAPELHARLGRLRAELTRPDLAWTLRRFERDLLEILGYGLPLDSDTSGAPLESTSRYRLDPELGAVRIGAPGDAGRGGGSIGGAALQTLAADTPPSSEQLRELRGALRAVLAHHLGPRGLRSWGLLGEFARLGNTVAEESGADGGRGTT